MAVQQYPPASGGAKQEKKVLFTSSGTWVCPNDVDYVIVDVIGGGGASAAASWNTAFYFFQPQYPANIAPWNVINNPGAGGDSSFSNDVVATGGQPGANTVTSFNNWSNGGVYYASTSAPVNTSSYGSGGAAGAYSQGSVYYSPPYMRAQSDAARVLADGADGAKISQGVSVTPGASYTITVGAGGTGASTNGNTTCLGSAGAGGSVLITYWQ